MGLARALPAVLLLLPALAHAAEIHLGPRSELTHPGKGHEVHASAPALAVTRDGTPLVTWATEEGHDKHVYVARPGEAAAKPVRVNPAGMSVESLHHSPLLAAGPGGEIYLSWSSDRPKPDGVLFASDLRLSRSLDGGVEHREALDGLRGVARDAVGVGDLGERDPRPADTDGAVVPRLERQRVGFDFERRHHEDTLSHRRQGHAYCLVY